MTTDDVMRKIQSIKGVTDDIWLDKVADIIIEIGNESLNRFKPTGSHVGMRGGAILEEWSVKDDCNPFHVKDRVTNKWLPDPRIILIGKLINEVGRVSGEGLQYMQEAYYDTMRKYHGSVRNLDYAWSGIGNWQS